MIDKLTPKFLDKSSDYKLVRKTSLIDALNIYVDVETGGEDSGGVIKPIKGTTPISPMSGDEFNENVNYRAVGSVTDDSTGIVYFFVWSSAPSEHGIWAYDHRGVLPVYDDEWLPGERGQLRRIVTDVNFNFPVNGFVKGDVVYSNTREFQKYDELIDERYPMRDTLLYFTDGVNEPKKVNVYRALLTGVSIPDDATEFERNQIKRDYLYACPRVPLDRVSFQFVADLDVDINNFAASQGFQFAYQNIYQDGLESALSPYSPVAFPPSIIDRGATQEDNLLAHNRCNLTIPAQNTEVKAVKILARQGNSLSFVELDEVQNTNPGEAILYSFYNDKIASGVSNQAADKTFDNLPQRAKTQSVVSNRLIYGNYVEGYDNVDCSGVNLDPVYIDRPPELLEYIVKIEPSIEQLGWNSLYPDNPRENFDKSIGFTIDSNQFNDSIAANTTIRVSMSLAPDKNFHFYTVGHVQEAKSYHQSRQVGKFSENLPGYTVDGISSNSAAGAQEYQGYGEPAYQNDGAAGGFFLQSTRENFFGNNTGISDPTNGVGWQISQEQSIVASVEPGNLYNPAIGTSAANPVILQGGKLSFQASFTVHVPVSSGGRDLINDVLTWILSGRDQVYINEELGLGDGAITFDQEDVKRDHLHEVDLGLSDFSPITMGSDYSNLICAGGTYASANNVFADLYEQPPEFAFIINKAKAKFFLEESARPTTRRALVLRLDTVDVHQEDGIMTCLRDVDPRSPWWSVSAARMQQTITEQDALQNMQVPQRIFHARTGHDSWFTNFMCRFSNGNAPGKATMAKCFGYMRLDGLYDDQLGVEEGYTRYLGFAEGIPLQLSIMDGEGGPGGSGAGQDTAYDYYGLDQYGSIPGQIFIGVDEDAILKSKTKGYQRYIVGDSDAINSGSFSQTSLGHVSNYDVASYFPLDELENDEGYYKHKSVAMGPFYTGRIVMMNISLDDADEDYPNLHNNTQLPNAGFADAFVTALPLVSFSSWVMDEDDDHTSEYGPWIKANLDQYLLFVQGSTGGSEVPNFASDALSSNLEDGVRQVSYPYPIVAPGEPGVTGIVNGELIGGEQQTLENGFKSVDFSRLHSHGEIYGASTSTEVEGYTGSLSFKSSATHEIGMVYYDERGRHGRVNPIGSVYIEGYGEREGGKGKAMIKVSNIRHQAPSWAKKYKFVYSKNTTYDSFIQYSAGGAFVANSDYNGSNPTNIYVSLNYLQGHPISYSDAYGARGADNTPVLYAPKPGDRLRVLSYMLSEVDGNINRVFPIGIEFDVTGVVNLGETDNPLVEPSTDGQSDPVPESRKGLFVVLKNNNDAGGFRYQSIQQNEDNWGNNCIFEIYSPRKDMDEEDRLYYETGEAYDVLYGESPYPDDTTFGHWHSFDQVILKEGDVFFRRHAVNLRDYSVADGFVDMLNVADNEEEDVYPESNFKNYYLESEAATDIFPSRVIGSGRPNIVDLDHKQSFRESSLIHSDRDVVESRKVGYSSFNTTVPSDMEIDSKAGPINYLANHQDSLFFIQKNKCGHIPVDRNLLSDTSGSQSLIASSKFLNTPRYYVGDAGCDDNPESVVNVDNAAYFAHKSSGKVFKVSGANGVNVISDKNMSAFIRNAFHEAENNKTNPLRILGGYDPLKKEYLLSVKESPYPSNSFPLSPEVTNPIYVGSEDVDADGVEGVDYFVNTEFEGVSFEDSEQFLPGLDLEWNLGSGFSDASWVLRYGNPGTSPGQLPNVALNGDLSYWSPDNFNVNVGIGAEPRMIVKINAPAEHTVGFVEIEIKAPSLNPVAPGNQGKMKVVETDIDDTYGSNPNSNILSNLDTWLGGPQDVNEEYPSGWHFDVIGLDSQQYVSCDDPYKVKIEWDPSDIQQDQLVIELPVRFICREEIEEDWYQIIGSADLANGQTFNVDLQSKIHVSSFGAAIVGTGGENAIVRTLSGRVIFGANTQFVIPEEEIDGGLTFDPCHPVYGLWSFTDENGYITSNTFQEWSLTGGHDGFTIWEEVTGFNATTQFKQDVFVYMMQNHSETYGGDPLTCPNINYPDDADTNPADL